MVLVLVLAVAVPIIVKFRNQLTNVIQTVTNSMNAIVEFQRKGGEVDKTLSVEV